MKKVTLIICCLVLVLTNGCGNRINAINDKEDMLQIQESVAKVKYSNDDSEETMVESYPDEGDKESKNTDSTADTVVTTESQDTTANDEDQTEFAIVLEKHDEFPVIPLSVTWGMEVFDDCYARANDEQKSKLDELRQLKEGINNVRLIYQIMGELPENLPRLTLDQAIAIGTEFQKNIGTKENDVSWSRKLARSYNQYVGAPDYLGGSSMEFSTYYVDEEKNEVIDVVPGMVMYLNNTTGEYKSILSMTGYIKDEISGREKKEITADEACEVAYKGLIEEHPRISNYEVMSVEYGDWDEMGFTDCWIVNVAFTDKDTHQNMEAQIGVNKIKQVLAIWYK